jgi:phage repressor protein C with HTH and peptisase S24 domain
LAQRVGLKQQAIGEIEAGRVQRPSRLRELSQALDRSEAWLLGEVPLDPVEHATQVTMPRIEPNAGAPVAEPMPQGSVPILGLAVGGADGRFVLNGIAVGRAFMPPVLEGVPNAYAVYVHGTSMVERYEPGETVWVNPYAPVARNDYVVAQIQPERRGDPPYGYVKRFILMDARRLVLEQLNPPDGEDRRMEFPRQKVISVHKIVFAGAS